MFDLKLPGRCSAVVNISLNCNNTGCFLQAYSECLILTKAAISQSASMLALASCQTTLRATFIMQTNSPHVFNVSAPAFQYTQRDRNQGQTHHPCDIKELFEIENKRAAGPHQKWDHQQRYHP